MDNNDDARTMPVELTCPGVPGTPCSRTRKVQTTTVATDVVTFTCPGCRTKWQVIIRPIKVNRQMAMRQCDWLELNPSRVQGG